MTVNKLRNSGVLTLIFAFLSSQAAIGGETHSVSAPPGQVVDQVSEAEKNTPSEEPTEAFEKKKQKWQTRMDEARYRVSVGYGIGISAFALGGTLLILGVTNSSATESTGGNDDVLSSSNLKTLGLIAGGVLILVGIRYLFYGVEQEGEVRSLKEYGRENGFMMQVEGHGDGAALAVSWSY